MSSRWELERAVQASGLPPLARLVVLVLLTFTDNASDTVPGKYGPSLSRLADATGMDRTTVARHLNRLERDGWIERRRPPVDLARSRGARTAYRIWNPGSGTAPLDKPDPGSGTAPLDKPDPSGVVPLGVVAQRHPGSGTAPHSPEASRKLPAAHRAAAVVMEATDATPAEAAAVAALIEREKQPRALIAFVRRLATDGELPDWLDRVRADHRGAALAKWVDSLATLPPCPHDVPGGDQLRPDTGAPQCPLCRNRRPRP